LYPLNLDRRLLRFESHVHSSDRNRTNPAGVRLVVTNRAREASRRWPTAPFLLALAVLAAACTGKPAGRPAPGASSRPSSPGATPQPGSSSPPAATDLHGLIAYSTESGDIWVMNADGSNRRQVTHAGGHD